MQIQENVSLRPYNTFGIDAHARFLVTYDNEEDIYLCLNYLIKVMLFLVHQVPLTSVVDDSPFLSIQILMHQFLNL